MSIRIERRERVLTIILSRSEVRNAVDPEHAEALYAAVMAFDDDDGAEVAVFWGEGGAFCAGADLKSLATRGIATSTNSNAHLIFGISKEWRPSSARTDGPNPTCAQ